MFTVLILFGIFGVYAALRRVIKHGMSHEEIKLYHQAKMTSVPSRDRWMLY
jgi:hypothetical protein